MGRVNHEDRYFSQHEVARIKTAAMIAGQKPSSMSGNLTFIWHGSQDELMLELAPEDVVAFSLDIKPEEGPSYIAGYVKGKFLIGTKFGTYIVAGNMKQIESQVNWMRHMKGGERKFQRWQKVKAEFFRKFPEFQPTEEQRHDERTVNDTMNVPLNESLNLS